MRRPRSGTSPMWSVLRFINSPYSCAGNAHYYQLDTNQNDALSRAGDLSVLTMALAVEGEGYRASHIIGIAGGVTAAMPSTWSWLKDASR